MPHQTIIANLLPTSVLIAATSFFAMHCQASDPPMFQAIPLLSWINVAVALLAASPSLLSCICAVLLRKPAQALHEAGACR